MAHIYVADAAAATPAIAAVRIKQIGITPYTVHNPLHIHKYISM